MPGRYVIEDLGVVAQGNAWMSSRVGRDPRSGAEVVLLGMSKGGIFILDPRTRRSTHVRSPVPDSECWGVAQAPDGAVYGGLYGSGEIIRWNWEGQDAQIVARLPGAPIFAIDVASDGRVYIPHYTTAHLHRFDPRSGTLEDCGDFKAIGEHIHNVVCGPDGLVYLSVVTWGKNSTVIAYDPASGARHAVEPVCHHGREYPANNLSRSAGGRALVSVPHYDRTIFFELISAQPRPVPQEDLRPGLALADGSFLRLDNRERVFDDHRRATFVDAKGVEFAFEIDRPDYPLRIFSIENGAGRIWCGMFMPLRLASFDLTTSQAIHLGNPTQTTGEIYNMAFSHGKLYMASYSGAPITCYVPDQPWRKDDSIHANPAHLGFMKEAPRLQRPYGKAIDSRGHVYFAARGDFGCIDSGIARVDTQTDEMTRWIYPNTSFAAMTYVKALDQLLVSERRGSEKAIRFLFVNPQDGSVVSSEPVIEDEGQVVAWLDSGTDLVYGLHARRSTLFAYSVSQRRILAEIREMNLGDHCHNTLLLGPDERIWGLTNQAVWAADRELRGAEVIADYSETAYKNPSRFGMCRGPDGAVYFPNGTRLMRVKKV